MVLLVPLGMPHHGTDCSYHNELFKNFSVEIFDQSIFKSGELLVLFACCLSLTPPSETEQSRGKSDNKTVPGNDHRSMYLSGDGQAQSSLALGSAQGVRERI